MWLLSLIYSYHLKIRQIICCKNHRNNNQNLEFTSHRKRKAQAMDSIKTLEKIEKSTEIIVF